MFENIEVDKNGPCEDSLVGCREKKKKENPATASPNAPGG